MTHKNHFYCAFLPHLGSPSTSPPRFLHRKGYKACLVTLVQPTSSLTIPLYSSTSFRMDEKRRNRETFFWKYKEGGSWAYREWFFLPFVFHGRVRLAYIGGHLGVPTKPCE
jgi:hypothetical protein